MAISEKIVFFSNQIIRNIEVHFRNNFVNFFGLVRAMQITYQSKTWLKLFAGKTTQLNL